MRSFQTPTVVVLACTAIVGCTRANPASCRDGTCTDPDLPFCDIDGAVAGHEFTCIAVDCTPGDFVACRGDEAITCNAAGTDYDVTQCPRGCGSDGCRDCSSDAECPSSAPICDPDSNRCRSCVIDDECASAVCDAGTCAPESTVVYAAPDGHVATSSCTHDSPCDLTSAIAVATTAISPPILRLLPGIYTQGVSVGDSALLRVVATGATLTTSGFTVGIGAEVAIRGATINVGITCTGGGTNNVRSSLTISESSLLSASQITTTACALDVNRSEFAGSAGMSWHDRSNISLDRVHVHIPTFMSLFADGVKISVKVTNSVLENVDFEAQASDTSEPGSIFSFAFNTWLPNDRLICRDFNIHQHISFENNIITSKSALSPNVIDATACVVRNNVLQPQATPPAMNLVGDPQFVDVAAGNFHLKPTSPAIDTAMPSASLGTDHDFDGIARPQGPALDIGAFELHP